MKQAFDQGSLRLTTKNIAGADAQTHRVQLQLM